MSHQTLSTPNPDVTARGTALGAFDLAPPTTADVADGGESLYPRWVPTANFQAIAASQAMLVQGFTAQRTELVGNVRTWTATTAAAATPTLVRWGVYRFDAVTQAWQLIAATPNDTALFAATNTQYTKAFTTPWLKTAGQRYALAVLIVTAAALPSFQALSVNLVASYNTGLLGAHPFVCASLVGQADLPQSFTPAAAAAAGTHRLFQAVLLP